MFGRFKKHKTTIKQIDEILAEFKLAHMTLPSIITQQALNKDVLTLTLRPTSEVDSLAIDALHQAVSDRLYPLGVTSVNFDVQMPATNSLHQKTSVTMHTPNTTQKTAPQQKGLPMHPRIGHIVVVASGKGGVGKSTTAVNIALALHKLGCRVGILDADIYGPSIPDMLGVAGVRPLVENDEFIPIDVGGIAMLSIGSLLDGDSTPVAWRGIKATGALMQLYQQTAWPNLDYLVIDMPPGTGDIQLTLAQRIPVTGAVIVTTPQHIALLDAKKGVEMFGKTQIPVIGIVENMALHTCSQCGHTEAIFGQGGADEMVATYGVPLLGRLPLAATIREQVDKGVPSVLADDNYAAYYIQIAQNIQAQIGQFAKVRDDGRIF